MSGPGRVCLRNRKRVPADCYCQAQHCGGSLERALTRMAGEREWSYRHCCRGRERCTGNSLLQVSLQPSGIFSILDIRREKIADLVPVDIPMNLAVAAAWKIASLPYNSIPVYNCTSGSINPNNLTHGVEAIFLKGSTKMHCFRPYFACFQQFNAFLTYYNLLNWLKIINILGKPVDY